MGRVREEKAKEAGLTIEEMIDLEKMMNETSTSQPAPSAPLAPHTVSDIDNVSIYLPCSLCSKQSSGAPDH